MIIGELESAAALDTGDLDIGQAGLDLVSACPGQPPCSFFAQPPSFAVPSEHYAGLSWALIPARLVITR